MKYDVILSISEFQSLLLLELEILPSIGGTYIKIKSVYYY